LCRRATTATRTCDEHPVTAPGSPDRDRDDRDRDDRDRDDSADETLPELLGEGSYDDKPTPYLFLLGLLGVAVFLGLVAFVFSHLSP
jgi:hypothetical protein